MESRTRDVLFREAVIHFLVGETDGQKKKRQTEEYCRACKAAKRDRDCDHCSRSITVRAQDRGHDAASPITDGDMMPHRVPADTEKYYGGQ